MINNTEQALSDTADKFEDIVNNDNATAYEFRTLLQNGQTPFVVRMLDRSMPGYMLLVRVEPQPK